MIENLDGTVTGTPAEHAARMDEPFGMQDQAEFEWLAQFVRGVRSILEIGSCLGHSLCMLAPLAVQGARIRSIDIGRGNHSLDGFDTGNILYQRIAGLRRYGFDAEVLLASSHSKIAQMWAAEHGPYDFIFIDGDHEYAGIKRDWLDYSYLGNIVAFHDIGCKDHAVDRLWSEIKIDGFRTNEMICSRMGTGVVFMDTNRQRAVA